MRSASIFTFALCGLAIAAASQPARGQVEALPGSLPFEEAQATLEIIQPNALRIRDAKNDVWLLKIDPQMTKIAIEGQAETDVLKPGLLVELPIKLDKKGNVQGAIEEVTIVTSSGKPALGIFPEGDTDSAAKAIRNPGAGSYHVRGKVASFRDRELVVAAGGRKLSGTMSEDAEVKINVDDLGLAQVGDSVKVKAWYLEMNKPLQAINRPGTAMATELTVTLAKPLTGSGKKPRALPERPARAVKSKTSK